MPMRFRLMLSLLFSLTAVPLEADAAVCNPTSNRELAHWYILYAFFHPQDWTDTPFDQEHENDLEGLLVIR
jgi:hypothetical protein